MKACKSRDLSNQLEVRFVRGRLLYITWFMRSASKFLLNKLNHINGTRTKTRIFYFLKSNKTMTILYVNLYITLSKVLKFPLNRPSTHSFVTKYMKREDNTGIVKLSSQLNRSIPSLREATNPPNKLNVVRSRLLVSGFHEMS